MAAADPPPPDPEPAQAAANDSLLRSIAPPGDRTGPVIGIDWGTPRNALDTIRANGMVVAVTRGEADVEVTARVEFVRGRWRREPMDPGALPLFAQTIRRVGGSTAFHDARRGARLRPGENLAVLLPREVEARLNRSLLAAARARGLAWEEVRVFAGRFRVREGGAVRFEIDQVVPW